MSCLDDIVSGDRVIIGIKDYAACATPESQLYLNDLRGMSLKMASQIVPEQWQSGAEFLRQQIILATRLVFNDFAKELQPYFNFANIVETREVKIFSTTQNAATAVERGIIIKRWRSEAARLFIEYIYVKVVQGGTVTIKIIDGSVTTEKEVTLVAGENVIRLDYKAEQEQVKIVFDQTSFDTYDCSFNKSTGCSSCGGSGSGKGIYIGGWNGTAETSNCYGIGAKVHVQCYEENILCSLLPKMYFLIWYKSGILVLKERIATDRINHISVFGKEKAEVMLEDYEGQYKENYNTLVKSAYNYLRTTKGECITCNGNKYVQVSP